MDDVRRRITELEPSYRTNELAASPEAVDLLRRFFVKSPAHRIDLGDCFEHPFMLKATASSTAADGTLNPSNHLIRYLNMTETKRLLLRAVASTLSSQHIAKLSRGTYVLYYILCTTPKSYALTMNGVRLHRDG
jgi:serine/threonine protein kinase